MSEYCLWCHVRYHRRMNWHRLLGMEPSDVLCGDCRSRLLLINGDVCQGCGRPFEGTENWRHEEGWCADCLRWQGDHAWSGVLEKNRSVYVYNDFLKEVISRWKFRGDYALMEAFRHDLCREFYRHFSAESLLVPIPLSRERLYERGFNQAAALAQMLPLPALDVLERSDAKKQSKKSRRERLRTEQLFRLRSSESLHGASIVLIDDIYTTGTTVRHAARMLREAGAAAVSSFTLARS
ncbi:ComF family protein [Anoxybacillus rupiensis]|uniref:ComF family protein n=1 Tax=Anoxybacteroides rupiense TaxID=311460 RepID=A0ABT5W5M5_9BACL|nr:ComF family protein [Anoxybacillus rupiensis]MDE8564492.1 ComF family protein [Anoxybacillus rupiensis]